MMANRHIILCGWNDSGRRLVADLLRSDDPPRVVVVTPAGQPGNVRVRGVEFIAADPAAPGVLDQAGLGSADVVVILAEEGSCSLSQDVDARTILIALAVGQRRREVHTIAELLNDENRFHARNAGVNEVLVSGAYGGTLLSQVVQSPGIIDVFSDLFRSWEGGRVVERALPAEQGGASFAALSRHARGAGWGILLGFRRGVEVSLAPPADTVLSASDRLLLLRRAAAATEKPT